MSSDLAIQFRNVGKRYRIGASSGQRYQYASLGERMADTLRNPYRVAVNAVRSADAASFWALKDVSFEVPRGEVVGVIGRNGAGKSTLLKVLSQITKPTEGEIEVRGRVGSLLEVGTGFHPELTGRENVFLNGAILGMTRQEVKRKFDEIVAFSEIERFLDTPVKQYSSGMYTRLAFAVAAHLDPEILVVDEVLAVGDAEFQKKCLGKMRDASRGGRTVLFVSHNMGAIKELCTMGVLLTMGRVERAGAIDDVIGAYMQNHESKHEVDSTQVTHNEFYGPGRILKAGIRQSNNCTKYIDPNLPIELYSDIAVEPGSMFSFGIELSQSSGAKVLHVTSQDDIDTLNAPNARSRLTITIPPLPLADGDYSIKYFLGDKSYQPQHVLHEAVCFSIVRNEERQRYATSPIVTSADWACSPMQ